MRSSQANPEAVPLKDASLTPLKRLELYISAIFKLGRIERIAKSARAQGTQLSEQLAQQNSRIEAQTAQTKLLAEQSAKAAQALARDEVRELAIRHAELARNYVDMSRRLDKLLVSICREPQAAKEYPKARSNPSELSNTLLDSFYRRLESKVGRTRDEVKSQQRFFLPDAESAYLRCAKKPLLDLGCGRGEWLDLMHEDQMQAIGVDIDSLQVSDLEARGRNVHRQDALTFLRAQSDASFSCITSFHLIEYLSFADVFAIVGEAMRTLAPGGLLVFETLNVANFAEVGPSLFNNLTNNQPLSESVLTALFETYGFDPIEMHQLHPSKLLEEFLRRPDFDPDLAMILFAPRDLAIIGTKPLGED